MNQFDDTFDAVYDHCGINEVKPIFISDCGSHAWGFASTKSDWDVKFLYHHDDKDKYLSLHEPMQHTTFKDESVNAEFTGYDIRKFLQLLLKGNANVYEMVASEYFYTLRSSHRAVGARNLRDFTIDVLNENTDKVLSHYYGLACSTYKARVSNVAEPTNKKWLYIIRPLLCCEFIYHQQTLPPLNFGLLLEQVNTLPADVRKVTMDILAARKAGIEVEYDMTSVEQWALGRVGFYKKYLANLKNEGLLQEKTLTNPYVFDIIYRELINGDFYYERGRFDINDHDFGTFTSKDCNYAED